MNGLTDQRLLDAAGIGAQIQARDLQMDNPYSKDAQVQGIRNARRYLGDRLGRVAAPHKILDSAAGPLIAVKLHILSRKTLGGIQTDLQSRALGRDGQPIDGLYAAGEVAGLGGGGAHGYEAPSSAAACSPAAPPAATSLTGSEHLTPVHHTTRRPARAAGRLDHHIPVRTRWPRPSSSHHGSWTGCPGARLGTEPLTGVLQATMPTLLIRPRAPGYSESPVPVPRTDGSLQGRRMLRLGVVAGRREPL